MPEHPFRLFLPAGPGSFRREEGHFLPGFRGAGGEQVLVFRHIALDEAAEADVLLDLIGPGDPAIPELEQQLFPGKEPRFLEPQHRIHGKGIQETAFRHQFVDPLLIGEPETAVFQGIDAEHPVGGGPEIPLAVLVFRQGMGSQVQEHNVVFVEMFLHVFLVAVETVPQVDVLVLFRPGDQAVDLFRGQGPVGPLFPHPHGGEVVEAVHNVDPAHIGGERFLFRFFRSRFPRGGFPGFRFLRYRPGRCFRSRGRCSRLRRRFRGRGFRLFRGFGRFRLLQGFRLRFFFRSRFRGGVLLSPSVPVPGPLVPVSAVPGFPGLFRRGLFPALFRFSSGFFVLFGFFGFFRFFGFFGVLGFPGFLFLFLQQGFRLVLLSFRIGHFHHFQYHPQGIGPEGLLFLQADPFIFQQQVHHGFRSIFADLFDGFHVLPHKLLQHLADLAQEGLVGKEGNVPVDFIPFLVQFHGKGNDFFPDPGRPFVQFPQLDDVFPVFPAVPLHGFQQHFHRGGVIDHLQVPVADLGQPFFRNGQGGCGNMGFLVFR